MVIYTEFIRASEKPPRNMEDEMNTFRSATEFVKENSHELKGIKGKAKMTIMGQPGYQRGKLMMVSRSMTGGYRLYVMVGVSWMDASLKDFLL